MLPLFRRTGSPPQRRTAWLPFSISVPPKIARILPFCLAIPFLYWLLLAPISESLTTGQIPWPPAYRQGPGMRPPPYPPPKPEGAWNMRAARVRDAFVHAYDGYWTHANLYDELLPKFGGKVNNFNGWGVTMYDALDTMWIMGLEDHFQEAVEEISKAEFKIQPIDYVPFFETVIRYLGGLLSAYALSGQEVLLERADALGKMLLPALNTASGFPMYAVNPQTGKTRHGWTGNTLWAEALSNQMEYKYLAHLTGNKDYYLKVEQIMQKMYTANVTDGAFPTMWNTETGVPANTQFSVGAYADSAHEYLLKQWLLTGQSEPKIRDLYIKTANRVIGRLLYTTPKRDMLYVTDTTSDIPSHNFEHLSCFLPGLLALGAHTLKQYLSPAEVERHQWAAKGLAYSCWISYADQPSGLGPDEMRMQHHEPASLGLWSERLKKWENDGRPGGVPPGLSEYPSVRSKEVDDRDYSIVKDSYLLRPESVESFYILWRTTGDEKWRRRGWSVFEAIEKHCRTKFGYASVTQVSSASPGIKDEMPSFFLAETLKYLYLLFVDKELVPLDKFVFNTEAHPLPIFQWKDWEKQAYGLGPSS